MMLALTLAMVFQVAPAKPCIVDGERLRGELRYVETHHPNGELIRSAFLYLDEPRCLIGEMGPAEGRWVQLLPVDQLWLTGVRSGSWIAIEAEDYEAPMTSWHIGDIVAFQARLVQVGPQ